MQARKGIVVVGLVASLIILLMVGIPALATIFQLPSVAPLSTPPNANIVYFTTNFDTPTDFTSPARLNQRLGARIVNTWSQVIETDQTSRIEALIIDSSALPSVDQSWVANTYQRGTVIAGFNINGSQMANLVDDNCIAANHFAQYESGSFFIVVSSSRSGAPEDINRALAAYNRSCEGNSTNGIRGATSLGFRRTSERLDSENTFNIFTRILSDHLD